MERLNDCKDTVPRVLQGCFLSPPDILQGSVGIMNNYNLCHIKTIKWKEIITDRSAKYLYVYKFKEPERDCAPCHESCEKGCWGPGKSTYLEASHAGSRFLYQLLSSLGPENCQQFSKINCSPQCGGGRCFGPRPRECCHQYCAGGCTGPTQKDCLVRSARMSSQSWGKSQLASSSFSGLYEFLRRRRLQAGMPAYATVQPGQVPVGAKPGRQVRIRSHMRQGLPEAPA